MSELIADGKSAIYLLPAFFALLLFVLFVIYRYKSAKGPNLSLILNEIAFERVDGLVIPSTDEGEIQIDHLLLTSQGLLIIDIKDIQGTVFGSNKMQDWAVITENRRFTFSNPQPALFDRIAAVRHIVREVPVAGRILFLDGAKFTKGMPELVCSLADLQADFGEADKSAAKIKIESFRQHWEALNARAIHALD